MGELRAILHEEREAAYAAAVAAFDDVVGHGAGYVHPMSRVEKLSTHEKRKIAEALISAWICERSRQLSAERICDEKAFLAEGSDPEPAALGHVASLLPAIGELVEARGIGELPINDLPKAEILLLFYNVADMATRAGIDRDERPTDPDFRTTLLAG